MSRAGWRIVGIIGLLLAASPAVAASQIRPASSEHRPRTALVRIVGTITYDGPLPSPIPIPEAGRVRHLVEVDPKTGGLKDAVIWLEGVRAPEAAGREVAEEPVVVDQKDYTFEPHVLAVEAGREVEFRNGDDANHGVSASSTEPRNRFEIVTPPGGRQSHRFAASASPVAIGCPVHGSMAAWVYVFEHPYHAVTGGRGQFRLPPVPPGRYILHVWHADGRMGRREEIVVRGGGAETMILRIAFHGDDLKAAHRPRKGASR